MTLMVRRHSRATVSFSCSQSNSSDNSASLGQRGILGWWMGDTLAAFILLGAGETGEAGVIVDHTRIIVRHEGYFQGRSGRVCAL